eukprot:TRINITY_DN3499_c0_g1_i1.p1 TRINITY_DN3499_c0_g1~~TRINITY_DN3499_c0_g1_i1.p1  ORF type:complete len:707 (-),score=228.05 TRINITY_DN3499_c0_g1_i1:9-2129(-)
MSFPDGANADDEVYNHMQHESHGDLNASRYSDLGKDNHVISDILRGSTTLDQILVRSQVNPERDPADEIMRIVNTDGCSASHSIVGSTVIAPGQIALINNNGRVEVAGTGRWAIWSPRSDWVRTEALTNVIQYQSLTIVRVPKGQYGLATENGAPVVLDAGLHAVNSRLFSFLRLVPSNQKHIHHGTTHIFIVPNNEYALVTVENEPKVLKPGHYVINSNYFTLHEFVSVDQPHIHHATIHIVRVPKGSVALCSITNRPALLPEGRYNFDTNVFDYGGLKGMNERVIVYGTITRFRIRNGEIGLAWDNNRPVFIERPDMYEVDSPSFNFVNTVSAAQKEIVLGSKKRIVVYDGEVGISYINGKLEILQPKTHVFDAAERIFSGFLSTRQQSLFLIEDGSRDQFLRCDTKDFVEVGLKAAVFYRISDPEKCLLSVGNEAAIARLIKETSIATLQAIMRSSALNQVAQSKSVHSVSHDAEQTSGTAPSAPLFFDKVHDEFISKLYDTYKKMHGVDISNIRIESFQIMDHALADNISQQAIITAQTETKLANLEGQREIATAEQEREAAVNEIKIKAAALQAEAETQTKNNSFLADSKAKIEAARIIAEGEALAMDIRANAEAKAILVRAEAEARSIERKAAAEKKRAEELSAAGLGPQIALLQMQSNLVTGALKGVDKIIYLPSNANLSHTPLQLFGMQSIGVAETNS